MPYNNPRKELEGKYVAVKDLRLGDRIQISQSLAYAISTVVGIRPDRVKVFRPFTHISDFSFLWSGGIGNRADDGLQVLHYIGIEEFELPFNSASVLLIEAGPTDINIK